MKDISKNQAWVDDFMDNQAIRIPHLEESEKIFFIQCKTCGEFFDSRKLEDVFTHVRHELVRLGRRRNK